MPVKTKKPRSGAYGVQGAVGADDPEHRPLVRVLEDGADLWSHFVRKDAEPGVGG